MEEINRIKVVLVEKKKTNKWLAQEMGKDPATVSKWCTNSAQSDLPTMLKIAYLLDVDERIYYARQKTKRDYYNKNWIFYLNTTNTNIGFVMVSYLCSD